MSPRSEKENSGDLCRADAPSCAGIRWLPEALLLVLAYPAWMRGGTHSGWQTPMPWLAILAWVVYLFGPWSPWHAGGAPAAGPSLLRRAGSRIAVLLRDPVFYAAAAFLVLILTQWFNSERALRFDYAANRWLYLPPRIPWLPSAIRADEAREMWQWFFPALSVLLLVRSGLRSRAAVERLFCLIIVNGIVLAVFGFAQYFSGTGRIYWAIPLKEHFFAAFGYSNHAASYFLLCLAATFGLAGREWTGACVRRLRGGRMTLLFSAAGILVVTAHLTLSRAAVVMTWSLVAVAVVWLAAVGWALIRPVGRVYAVTAAAALAAVVQTLVGWRGDVRFAAMKNQISETRPAHEYSLRGWQYESAIRMWREHPWFGVGGWGYRHLVGFYMDPSRYAEIRGEGRANVHNDLLQFLAEFGAVGTGLLLMAAGLCLKPVRWRSVIRSPLPFFVLFGLAGVVAHSLLDLPFRSPAVLYLWCAMLAAVGIGETEAVGGRRAVSR